LGQPVRKEGYLIAGLADEMPEAAPRCTKVSCSPPRIVTYGYSQNCIFQLYLEIIFKKII
jgi:hypothetical protein